MGTMREVLQGILIPFAGTSAGAACVFFMKQELSERVQRVLVGFAAGVMTAASVWSLILPAVEQAAPMGRWSFLPAAAGFWIGVLFLMVLDRLIPRLRRREEDAPTRLQRTLMLVLAVVLHNIPEGMAVGAVFAGYLAGEGIGLTAAVALAAGIAIQNFPEGAIISMPLRSEGMGIGRAFGSGVLSGAVEPAAALLTILASGLMVPLLPYVLGFAAGAMMYVVVAELIPAFSPEEAFAPGTLFFSAGFTVMMALDVALG